MLVSTSFTHSPQGITQPDDPAAAAAVMGPYYPRAAVCPLATLTAHGAAGTPAVSKAAGIRYNRRCNGANLGASGRRPLGTGGRRK